MPVHFLLHVPKTAGITIAEHLEENCPPGLLWRPLHHPLRAVTAPRDPASVRAVALGHYHGQSLTRLFPGRALRPAVLLRDPVSLQVSYYNWRMMYYLERGEGVYSFDLHLDTLPRNFMLDFLLNRWLEIPAALLLAMPDAEKLARVQRALKSFWFVGAYTDAGRLLAALASELGVPATAAARNSLSAWREFVDWTPLTEKDLTPGQRQRLARDQALDQLLWDCWHQAGFDAAAVTPREMPANPARPYRLLRPALEAQRLWWRKAAAPPTLAALHASLTQEPQSRAAWRAFVTQTRQLRFAGPELPQATLGAPQTTRDPVIALMKAEYLLARRRADEAAPYLRLAPALAATRRQGQNLTRRAVELDRDFTRRIAEADRVRDSKDWMRAATLYRAALALYPLHAGYRLQLGHCQKLDGDLTAAEISYRSGRALGAWLDPVALELTFLPVTQPQGWLEKLAHRRISLDGNTMLDEPPTGDDISIALLLAGSKNTSPNDILSLLREMDTNRALLAQLMPEEQNEAAQAQFLSHYHAQALAAALGSGRMPAASA